MDEYLLSNVFWVSFLQFLCEYVMLSALAGWCVFYVCVHIYCKKKSAYSIVLVPLHRRRRCRSHRRRYIQFQNILSPCICTYISRCEQEGGKKNEIKKSHHSIRIEYASRQASKQAKHRDENFMRELNHIKNVGMGILCKAQAISLSLTHSLFSHRPGILCM